MNVSWIWSKTWYYSNKWVVKSYKSLWRRANHWYSNTWPIIICYSWKEIIIIWISRLIVFIRESRRKSWDLIRINSDGETCFSRRYSIIKKYWDLTVTFTTNTKRRKIFANFTDYIRLIVIWSTLITLWISICLCLIKSHNLYIGILPVIIICDF